MNMSNIAAILTVLTMLGISNQALAEQRIQQSLDTVAQPNVEIINPQGRVIVKTWDKSSVNVEGTIEDDGAEFIFRTNGNSVVIEVESQSQQGSWFSQNYSDSMNAELTVTLPRDSHVSFESINGSLELSGVTRGVNASVVNGEIAVQDSQGRMNLSSVNGSIDAKAVQGRLRMETVNGDIDTVHLGNEEVSLSTVNGEIILVTDSPEIEVGAVNAKIDLQLGVVQSLDIEMVNGNVDASLELGRDARVDAESVDGRMDFRFLGEVSALFNIEAFAGGKISNSLTQDKVQKEDYGPSKELNFAVGQGNARVNIETVSGRINIQGQ